MNRADGPVVAVTGAAGVIGRHLCAALAAGGWRVRALVRRPDSAPAGCDAFACDLPDRIDPAAVRGAEVLIHAAYATRTADPREAERVNEAGSRRLFDLARAEGVGRVVFVSSFSARPDAASYYGQSKHRVEQLLDPTRDLAVRPGLVLAPDGGLFRRIADTLRRARVMPVAAGGRIVQTVHVDDLTAAFRAALDRRLTGVVHVAEPAGRPFAGLLRLVLRATGRRCLLVPVPAAAVLAGLRLAERCGLRLSVTSDNLLGLRELRAVPVAADLARLGVDVRPAEQSVADLLGPNPAGGREPIGITGGDQCSRSD